MKNSNCLISACRSCRYYSHQGRRGGQCQRLGVPVESTWKACSLAFPPFAPSWEHFEDLMSLKSEAAERHESLTPKTTEGVPTKVRASAPAVTPVPVSQPILV